MEQIEIKQVKAWYQNPLLWIGLGVAGCLVLLAMPHVTRTYHYWSGRRALKRAQEAYAKGNYQQAILDARGALACNPKDVEATRIIAKTAEALGAPQALELRRQVDALKPGDTENMLGMVEALVKSGDSVAAAEVLKNIRPADQNNGRYHDLAAGIAMGNHDIARAETHWTEACRLEPQSDEYRFKLAVLRLSARQSEVRVQAQAEVEELSAKPGLRMRSLRALLSDAAARGDSTKARSLAATLAADPEAVFSDKLARLSTLRAGKIQEFSTMPAQAGGIDPEFSSYLEEMQVTAAAQPEQVYQLLVWMNDHHLALLVPGWVDKLPTDMVSKAPVAIAVAEAYARASDWKRLKVNTEGANWQNVDFLRLAFLCRALDRLDDAAGARSAWSKAVATAEARPEALEMLVKEVQKWGWDNKAEEVLQKLAGSERCPRWVVDRLWTAALKRGDTMELYKVSRLILKADPKSIAGRNNYISLALLTGQEGDLPRQLAEALFRENPTDATVCSTYGFALYQQGKAEEAVALMEKLAPEQLRVPTRALYFGIFLAVAGQDERAEEYLQAGMDAPQLPEEKALGDFLRNAVRAAGLEHRGDVAGATTSWNQALTAAQARADWLEMLGRMALRRGWSARAEAVVLKLAATDRCPRWATETLWAASLKSGDSGQLYKASKLIEAADTTNVQARNTSNLLALLTGRDGDSPQRLAETLFRQNSSEARVVATQAFSLTGQGRQEEAVKLMIALKGEQLKDPQIAFYLGLALMVAGQAEKAAEYLDGPAMEVRIPEEKTLLNMSRLAGQTRKLDAAGDGAGAGQVWSQALALAGKRSDWLEMLARMAGNGGWPQRAETVLWKLSDDPNCPKWVIDTLYANAEKGRDTALLYKASKLKSKADPRNVTARSSFVRLSLLTNHAEDFPHRLAEGLVQDFPGNAQAAISYGLSLFQRGRENEAVSTMSGLPAAQLREPLAAFYYGLFLAAAGQAAKAEEFLQIGASAPLFPEERSLLAKLKVAAGTGATP